MRFSSPLIPSGRRRLAHPVVAFATVCLTACGGEEAPAEPEPGVSGGVGQPEVAEEAMESSRALTAAFSTVLLLLVTFTSVFAQNAGDLIGGAAGLAVAMVVLTERWEVIPHGDRGGVSLAPLAGLRPRYGGTTMILGTRVRF